MYRQTHTLQQLKRTVQAKERAACGVHGAKGARKNVESPETTGTVQAAIKWHSNYSNLPEFTFLVESKETKERTGCRLIYHAQEISYFSLQHLCKRRRRD